MASVIEINDSENSDDDSAAHTEISGLVMEKMESPENSQTNEPDKNNEQNAGETATENSSSTETPDVATTTSPPGLSTKPKRSRKSVHQPLRASPEIEFESEPVPKKRVRKKPKAFDEKTAPSKSTISATTPKVLTMQKPPTTMQQLLNAHAQFHLSDKSQQIIRRIAKERVRVNYLLNLYGMPQINFVLNTEPERLQFQFEDRMKHWKMRHMDMAARLMGNNMQLQQKQQLQQQKQQQQPHQQQLQQQQQQQQQLQQQQKQQQQHHQQKQQQQRQLQQQQQQRQLQQQQQQRQLQQQQQQKQQQRLMQEKAKTAEI